jgi:thioredoxin 1
MDKFNEIIQGEIPVLIDFYADWCAPCRMMPPVLKQVKETFGDRLKIIKVDTDKNPQLSQQLQIRSIPTLMLFEKGEKKWQTSGVMPANQLINTLQHYTN